MTSGGKGGKGNFKVDSQGRVNATGGGGGGHIYDVLLRKRLKRSALAHAPLQINQSKVDEKSVSKMWCIV
jgi:hypothetical protein